MAFSINVSYHGKHYFATTKRSIGYDRYKLKEMYTQFLTFFPESEGYKLTVTNWEERGKEITPEEILKS